MPNSYYYGLSDLSTTIVSLFCALAVMGMYDAMFRMFFEKKDEDYKKDICSSAFAFSCITSLVVSLVMVCLREPISFLFYRETQYGNLVMLCALSVLIGATNSIVSAPTRMQNKRKVFLVTNFLSPVISYSIAIPLLLNGHYLIALPLATLISATTLELAFAIMNYKWFSFKRVNWKYIRSMLTIALPLLPNFIIYWIFNSSDRVMISSLLNTSEEGVYAVSSKIGHISQLIYTAFAGGWQYFAFSIMSDDDNVNVISKIFDVMLAISLGTTLLGTSVCKFGIEILFKEEYWRSYICVPYLYLAPLLLMLFQIGTNQFLVIKKTWPNLIILSIGAVANIALNFVLIPIIGIEGASIATFVGYFISIIICIIVLLKFKLIIISKKTIISFLSFIIIFLVMRSNSFSWYALNIPLAIAYVVLLLILFKNDFKNAKVLLKKKKYNKNNCIKKHIEEIKEKGIDTENLDKYVITYDNNHKDFLMIGYIEHENNNLIIKYVLYDDTIDVCSRLIKKCEEIFNEYDIDEIVFEYTFDDEELKNIHNIKRRNIEQ
ncbi:MAG: oligosaccharide flippase family protein, partial [Acholeplasmatales bacterium]|nr:oligosaccharide flippase family protein [Acholeplasmatales bacterium]